MRPPALLAAIVVTLAAGAHAQRPAGAPRASSSLAASRRSAIVDAAARVGPAVVSVTVKRAGADVILQIDRMPVNTAEDATRLLQGNAGRAIRVFFERSGQIIYTDVYAR